LGLKTVILILFLLLYNLALLRSLVLVNNPPQRFRSNLQIDLVTNNDIHPNLNTEFNAVTVELMIGLDVVDQLEFVATD
jgi:predicted component of type VI protein secretion system